MGDETVDTQALRDYFNDRTRPMLDSRREWGLSYADEIDALRASRVWSTEDGELTTDEEMVERLDAARDEVARLRAELTAIGYDYSSAEGMRAHARAALGKQHETG